MAGEIEDFFTLQADSLPTGSISFGRFELESLSWERRSSFSHNRYLEEVEKYSTPGSVTQKKAYFEAHFRKKALEREASSVNHNGVDCQTSENCIEDHVSYLEDYVDLGNGASPEFVRNDGTSDVSDEQEHDVMESTGRQLHFSWYDDTPPAVSDEDEYDVIENNEGQLQFLQYDEAGAVLDDQHYLVDCQHDAGDPSLEKIPTEEMPSDDLKALNYPIELVEHDEVIRNESRYVATQSDKDGSVVVVEHKKENAPLNMVEQFENCKTSSKISLAEEDNASCLKKTQQRSYHVKSIVDQKPLKAKLQNPVSVMQTTRKTSTEKNSFSSAKASTRILRKAERESTSRTKTEKQLPLKVSPSEVSDSKNLKSKNSESLKAQSRQGTKSGKGPEAKKDGGRPRTTVGNDDYFARQSANRNYAFSTKVETKQSRASFSFRSDERAEKRKEFYNRLEEKHHSKEVEMFEIQARTQMETEAQMKQFRRSLNFKATPMPSFYHGSVPRDSNGRKMVAAQTKPLKLQSKSTSPVGNSPAVSRATEKECCEQVNAECPSTPEDDMGCSVTSQKPDKRAEHRDSSSRVSQSGKAGSGKREERVKPTVQQEQGERQDKKGLVRRGGVGKMMKGIVVGSVPVHVAS